MSPNDERSATDDRKAIDENVGRLVGIAALRRIHKLIAERERELRLLRTRVAPAAAILTIVIAVLIWLYFNQAQAAVAAPELLFPPRGSVAI